jgi:hypothetical protein
VQYRTDLNNTNKSSTTSNGNQVFPGQEFAYPSLLLGLCYLVAPSSGVSRLC